MSTILQSVGGTHDGVTITDALHRPLRDLRISVTDRCNFRCPYCMPKEVFGRDWAFLPRAELLSFEEIVRLARVFVTLGIEKIRITGGEPLLRRDLPKLIAGIARIEGARDLTLTTNGALLSRMADDLKQAGLQRLTVSLDAIDEAVFRAMSDVNIAAARVLDGIDAAVAAGLHPIKVNMVVKRGMNDQCIGAMAGHFRHTGHILRFIEYMDVGDSNGWRMQDVVPAREIIGAIEKEWPLEPLERNYAGEVATRYRYCDGGGEIGMIASVTQPFCRGCTRSRITADGTFYTCLFATRGHDLRQLLRQGKSDGEIGAFISSVWRGRSDRYSEIRRGAGIGLPKVEMSRVGG